MAIVSGTCPKCESVVDVRSINASTIKKPTCPVCRTPLGGVVTSG